MLNQVNLADVRSFVLIAELGNFTKAAEVLGVSRSHVSRQLSGLEKQMGVTLINRTTRTLKLTQAGVDLFESCQGALAHIDQALIAAVDDVQEVRGEIRVNCVGGYLGEALIAGMISRFMGQYPQTRVKLSFSSHRVDLISDEFDLAFRMGELEDAGFIGRHLMDIEMVTLASPNYIHTAPELNEPKQLSAHHCLTGSVKHWHYQRKDNSELKQDVRVNGRFDCANGRALVTSALAGNGIIRVPLIYCEEMVNQGKLVPLLPDWHIPKVPFYAIYHKDKYQPQRLRKFIEFIVQEFNKQ